MYVLIYIFELGCKFQSSKSGWKKRVYFLKMPLKSVSYECADKTNWWFSLRDNIMKIMVWVDSAILLCSRHQNSCISWVQTCVRLYFGQKRSISLLRGLYFKALWQTNLNLVKDYFLVRTHQKWWPCLH